MKKYIHIPSKQKMPKISYRHSPIMQDTPNRFELKVGSDLELEMRHPIDRMKIHTREMVRFVDTRTSERFAESYGETSDKLKELIIDFYKKLL